MPCLSSKHFLPSKIQEHFHFLYFPHLGSISPTFYEQLLSATNTDDVTVFLHFWNLSCIMLVKLTPGNHNSSAIDKWNKAIQNNVTKLNHLMNVYSSIFCNLEGTGFESPLYLVFLDMKMTPKSSTKVCFLLKQ
jgi:hypothetical protein